MQAIYFISEPRVKVKVTDHLNRPLIKSNSKKYSLKRITCRNVLNPRDEISLKKINVPDMNPQ